MKILMVCLGNICRSPLAEGIMQSIIDEKNLDWSVDSCGTGAWHAGESPDRRSVAIAKMHNIDISHQRARQITKRDLSENDLILAMDSSNYQNILKLTSSDIEKQKVHLILNFEFEGLNKAVPDPYYDGGFENVFRLLDRACKKIVETYLKK